MKPERRIYEIVKRATDVVAAVLLLVALAPLLLAIAAVVKCTSRGPVLYFGTRTGLRGRPFSIIKFRSMIVGADRGAGTTSRNDARITAIGKILRRYKLDELPQLFNIVRGDMSFVGPRPELPRYTDLYSEEELAILSVRPGITDLSSLRFSDLGALIDDTDPDSSFETEILPRKNALRLEYVRRRGLLLDLSLVLRTAALILARPFGRRRG